MGSESGIMTASEWLIQGMPENVFKVTPTAATVGFVRADPESAVGAAGRSAGRKLPAEKGNETTGVRPRVNVAFYCCCGAT